MWEAVCKVFNEVKQRALPVDIHFCNSFGIADFIDLVLRHGFWQVTVNTAWAEISCMHSSTGNGLVHVEQVFAFSECID